MKRILFASLLLTCLFASTAPFASSHCEVPCGIYNDKLRFEQLVEDKRTMGKAMAQIRELAEKKDALSVNQLARWVSTKGEHATRTQHIVTQYFMTQRIKPAAKNYVEQLTSAHAVLLSAMKCKQTTDADAIGKHMLNIDKLYMAYTGKDMRAKVEDK